MQLTSSYTPDDSVFYNDSKVKNDPKLKLLINPLQEERERRLIRKVEIDAPHMDRLTSKSNESMVLTKDFQNRQMLLEDDSLIRDLIPKPKKKKHERRLKQMAYLRNQYNHRRKKRHVLEGLDDLGVYDISSLKKHKRKIHLNIPVRVLTRNLRNGAGPRGLE